MGLVAGLGWLVLSAGGPLGAVSAAGGGQQQEPIRVEPRLFGVAHTIFVSPSQTVRTVTDEMLGQDVWQAFQAYFWDYGHAESRSGAASLFAALRPGLIGHYPGVGVVTHDFHWKDVIGPLSGRLDPTPRQSSFDTDLMRQFGPDEYGKLVEEMRARTGESIAGSIQVNVVNGTAEDAADWVEYMNAPNDGSNPRGGTDWAARRAANGHPAPYKIHYWELGNEPSYTAENIGSLTAWEYVDRIKSFVPLMKKSDPSIEVMAYVNPFNFDNVSQVGTAVADLPAGPAPDGSEPAGLTWSQAVIKHAGSLLDMLYFHWYGGWNQNRSSTSFVLTSTVKGLVPWLDRLQQDIQKYAPDAATRTRLASHVAIPEWNSYGGFTQPIDVGTEMLGALADSRILHTIMGRKEIVFSERLALAAPNPQPALKVPAALQPILDIRSGYFALWTQPGVATYVQTPVYLMGTVWGRAFQPRVVQANVSGLPSSGGAPLVDVTALASTDSSHVSVIVTNASSTDLPLACTFDQYAVQGTPTLLVLHGSSLTDHNWSSSPHQVTVQEQSLTPAASSQVTFTAPGYSVVALLVQGSRQ